MHAGIMLPSNMVVETCSAMTVILVKVKTQKCKASLGKKHYGAI